jgi:hypothetical protein
MIWMSLSLPQWRRARLVAIGGLGGGSLATVENPFATALARGARGHLCTGPTVWSFVVIDGGQPSDVTTIELSGAEPYDRTAHGAVS